MTEPESAPPVPADIQAMSADAARDEIDRIRAAADHPWAQPSHRQHAEALTRMEMLYRKIAPPDPGLPAPKPAPAPPSRPPAEATPPADPSTPEPTEEHLVVAADLPPGHEWDEPTLNALGDVADREQIDPGLLREGTALVSRLLAERAPALTGEEAEDLLERRWGSKYEYQIGRATEVWNLLPKKVQDDLTTSGIRYHPEFAEYLLRVGEHRWDPMTDAGLRRIKARSLAALEKKETKP
jgi:hypothetical protein